MKKRRGGKKKVKHSTRKRFKHISLFNDRTFTFLLIAVFLVLAFLLGFVNKTGLATQTPTTGQSVLSDFFTNWEGGNLDTNITKYLFWFMVTALIWSALSFAKFPEQGVFQALIALPAGFLATAYLTPAEVFTVLQSYETLGIVLTFIVPFMLMLFFSAMFLSNQKVKSMSVPKVMMEVFLWIFFAIILGYKMISGFATGKVDFGLNMAFIIMVGIFFISSMIVIFNKGFRHWMWNLGNDIRTAQSEASRVEQQEARRTANAMGNE
ncbi:MAG: hypothetical protein NTU63_01165 [Candidatus Pacearchaeota archaeon]|nr:hypothetical protein [Candidatus Pacearchaeota archaeon]